MVKGLSLEQFLERNRIDVDTWEKANIEWPTLQAIAVDHEAEYAKLENSAEFFAKEIQKFNGVHSVRWRVKDSEHLLEKIVRKRSEGNPKYTDITHENYFIHVTDLVGIRALHLFKENCFEIDAAIKALWKPIETPVAYIREGDNDGLTRRFEEVGFAVKDHPAGYRSVHYVIESIPLNRKIIAEIQVRTIFEEGWSEIDHKIRYPNFSNNELVRYFLEIFNRMAGSADDMGGFVLGLVATLSHLEEEIIATRKEKEAIFKDMEQTLNQLESVKKQDKASKENIAKLKAEVSKLKQPSTLDEILTGSTNREHWYSSAAEQARRGLSGTSKLRDLLATSAVYQSSFPTLSEIFAKTLEEQDKFNQLGSKLSDLMAPLAVVPVNADFLEKKKIPPKK